jgi:serine/threonine-protein kinase
MAEQDRYQLDGEIARGSMACVLRGRDVDLGRDVAVKVLLGAHAGQPDVVRRFIEKAQIGGQLQHPGIPPIYDVGRFGDRPFFVMKLVKGRTLAALLTERSTPEQDLPRFLAIFEQVCQTVAYAHAKGVIHRDLKPANVVVGAFGEVQVMDWGLAKVIAGGQTASPAEPGDTPAGVVLGTPAYVAPEQARGASVDERADVFGLGAILCEILTASPPHGGANSEETLAQAASANLANARARLDACAADAELIGLARRCLAGQPAERPSNAGELSREVSAYLGSVEARLRQAELERARAEGKTQEERNRRRVQLALAGSVLLNLVLGGTAIAAYFTGR